MPDTPSIVTIKDINYRGQKEQYSNRYHFSGTTPANDAAWLALFQAIVALERPVLPPMVRWIGGYGYNAGSPTANWVYNYDAAAVTKPLGTYTIAGSETYAPGDSAVWVRWYTPNTSTTGKRIYLRKYFHPAIFTTADSDNISAGQKTALGTFGAAMIAGTLPGSVRVCGPQGAVASAPVACSYITTRTLKRRGRRPTPA